jgi:hypothetical protein
MQARKSIKNFFAVLLILVFSLKAGIALYLHNSYHAKNNCSTAAPSQIKLACTCIADFYLPYTEASHPKIIQPNIIYQDRIYSFVSPALPTFSVFYSLRAPPMYSWS